MKKESIKLRLYDQLIFYGVSDNEYYKDNFSCVSKGGKGMGCKFLLKIKTSF